MQIDEKSVQNPNFPQACKEMHKEIRKCNLAESITNIIGKTVGIFSALFVTGITLSLKTKKKKRRDFIIND